MIDVLLIAGGVRLALWQSPWIGVPLVLLGLITPALHWAGRRRNPVAADAYRLVPDEVAEHHCATVAAAQLPGVTDGPAAIDAADDALLEVAALLVGRPPRTGAQRRFVAARVAALAAATAELTERHEAWVSAREEVERIAFPLPGPLPADEPAASRSRSGLLVGVFVVALFPAFALWDLLRALGAVFIGLLDGLALRLSTVGTTLARAARGLAALARRARKAWRRLLRHLVAAASEARRRVTSIRMHVRLAWRRLQRRQRRRGVRTG